jgi:hypothetical protein
MSETLFAAVPGGEGLACPPPLPFLLQFLAPAPFAGGDDTTVAETPGQTSTDGKLDDDTVDDTDEDDPSLPVQTGVIADSDPRADEDDWL